MKEEKGNCNVCGKDTKLYCSSCAETWGEFTPTWFCEEHYESVVLSGNCCSGSEQIYAKN